MARFLIDESLPRSLTAELISAGHEAAHIVDAGLRGVPDERVHQEAGARMSILLTADLGFGDVRRYPPQFGTVIVRIRKAIPRASLRARVLQLLGGAEGDLREMTMTVLILEPGRRRVRKV